MPTLLTMTMLVVATVGLGSLVLLAAAVGLGSRWPWLFDNAPRWWARALLAAAGVRVRAYVLYGVDWYGYLVRRLAERPANLRFFLRSLVTTS